jgi:ATP-binding cassette subfamily E protein 1
MVRMTKDQVNNQLIISRQECKRSCPVVKMGKLCIEVNPTDKKAFLSEELCIGCGICVKK